VLAVAAVEGVKLRAQPAAAMTLVGCAASPFVFAIVMVVQSTVPADTLFGRGVKESGFATPLVVLGFAALWIFPVLGSIVGGDVFSADDRYRTWPTILTRSRSRTEVFLGKVATALAFSAAAVIVLAVGSLAAGMIVIGRQPLIDLSGELLGPGPALTRVLYAWASVVPPIFGFTALAMFCSVLTQSSAAGIGLPVVVGLAMQLSAYVDGPESVRRLLLTSSFEAWHGLLTGRPYYGPLISGTVVSGLYVVVSLTAAYLILRRRDIGG
jgi:ABC-2 type transport system permease protein